MITKRRCARPRQAAVCVALLVGLAPLGCGSDADPRQCTSALNACPATAQPDRSVTGFQAQNQIFEVAVPYGEASCADRYVYEVPIEGTGAREIWLFTLWSDLDIDTEQECRDETIAVDVTRQDADGIWHGWDSYRIVGVWQEAHCLTRFECGGKQSAAEASNPYTGFPWSWVDVGGGTRSVRAAIGGGTPNVQRPLVLGVADSPL